MARPSEPGPTAVANKAAPHQTDTDAASARGPSSSDPLMAGVDWDDLDHGLSDFDHGYDDDDEYKDDYEAIWDDETTWHRRHAQRLAYRPGLLHTQGRRWRVAFEPTAVMPHRGPAKGGNVDCD